MYSYIMAQKEVKKPHLLTLAQACEILQVHPNTLRAWDNKGYLKAVRLGARGDRRYKKSEVMKLAEGKK
jgi:excisionase family DNA binding protein